jgi:lipopolysaccharide biosynthesis protein
MTEPTIVAFYLPQFHPIPENDTWWGPGFSEWTNTAAARPLFRGHHQPDLPGELGFYDLRTAETRIAQAELAKSHGIGAFAYWHYWFDGKLLLETPLERVLASGEPHLPFCVAWANHSWSTNTWTAVRRDRSLLIEQTYPGDDDHRRHFHYLLPFFSDPRYLRVEGRPLVYVREPAHIPQLARFVDLWRSLAADNGLGDLWFVGEAWEHVGAAPSMDRTARFHRPTALPVDNGPLERLRRRLLGHPIKRRWDDLAARALEVADDEWPVLLPNWDTTPRRGRSGTVLTGTSPDAFGRLLADAMDRARSLEGTQVVFVKSWNEWAEGNHLEPDRRHGRGWLEAVRAATADNAR